MRSAILIAAGLGLGLCAAPGAVRAHDGQTHDGQAHDGQAHAPAVMETVRPEIGDHRLFDQTGAERRLAGDVFADRLLVLDFIFTSCSTTCPLTTAILADFRAGLEPALADRVGFVSISTDPSIDTPERLAAYAQAFGLDERWTFLTGDKPVADQVLKDFGAYTTNPEDHPQLLMVGDARSGEFVRIYGLPEPDRLLEVLEYFAARRAGAATVGGDG